MIHKFYLTILIFLSFASFSFAQQTLVLKGKIYDAKTKEPLAGAYIHFDDLQLGALTDAFGDYSFKGLIPGKYKVKVKYVGYKEFEKEIELSSNASPILNVAMEDNSKKLGGVTIYSKVDAESDLSSRQGEKNALNIKNIISAQAMTRSPDINAANALQRVSALTLQRSTGSDAAYAIIRGLEPRYNNTLINGVKVASPDPVSRSISLSIVPSDLLQRIEVSKSLTPDMEGDAIGGTVNLVFKDAPNYEYFKASASAGYNALFINRDYNTFNQGAVQRKSVSEQFGTDYKASPGSFSRPNLSFGSKTAPITSLASFTYGRRVLNQKLGFIISDSYQNQFYGSNSQFNIAQLDTRPGKGFQPIISDIANRTYSTQQLNNGLSAHLDYKFDDKNKVALDNIFLYTQLNQTRLSIDTSIVGGNGGRLGPGTGAVFNDNRSSINNQYAENLKLSGEHLLSQHFKVDWAGVYSNAKQDAPDRAVISTNHLVNPDFSSTPDFLYNVSRIWDRSRNRDVTALGNVAYKTTLSTNSSLELKAGGLYRHSTRYNIQNQYTLKPLAGNGGEKTPFKDIYSSDFVVYDVSGSLKSDKANYTAYEDISAGYGQFTLTANKFSATGGLRIENTKQGYDTKPVVLDIRSNAQKKYTDLLPSLQLKYELTPKSNLRASYFKSISRPALYELVPTVTFGDATDVTGNPLVKHTEADNLDLRFEFFPKQDEQFLIGGFYKNIVNPIEFGLNGLLGGQQQTSPQNFGTAKVYGVELVYSRFFGKIGISGNYTYTHSNINTTKIFTSTDAAGATTSVERLQSRPLQGQTGNVANLSLLYKNDKHKAFVQLAYSYTDKTLVSVYPNYGYDYYQQPQSFLSLSGEKKIYEHLTLAAKVNNILNTPTTIKIGGLTQSKEIYNVSFNLGLRYSL
ncbi:outer membrane receptor protein involved in Fe transport [Pedobacter sp. UYP30]|uniref:TonB-dependent receptor n=1 Tax=Pedobacter sp. UYP30 TaxID=1756400 RepID=UPI00339505D6